LAALRQGDFPGYIPANPPSLWVGWLARQLKRRKIVTFGTNRGTKR